MAQIRSSLDAPILIFLHIPKTAGTSLLETLRAGLPADAYLNLYGVRRTSASIRDELTALPEERKRRIRLVAGHQVWFGVHELFGRDAAYVTFLRSPVARVLSCYRMIMREPGNSFHPEVMGRCPSFSQYVSDVRNPLVANHMCVMLGRQSVDDNHNADMCPQVDQKLLDTASRHLERFAFVGIQERYQDDCRALCKQLSFPYLSHHEKRAPTGDAVAETSLELESVTMRRCLELNWADTILYQQGILQSDRDRARMADEAAA